MIVGHDVAGFDIEVLLHRIMVNKVPNWSLLGRLKRSQPLKGRFNEKQATTGRLVCDLKISSKGRVASEPLKKLVKQIILYPFQNQFKFAKFSIFPGYILVMQ